MKNNELLRIYNKFLVIDPEIPDSIINKYEITLSRFTARRSDLTVISDLYEGMVNQISFFKNIRGYLDGPKSCRKVLVDPEYEFFAYLENWWPSISEVFDFSKPVLLPCIAEIIKSRFSCSISDLPETYTGKDFFSDIFSDFKDYIDTQEWFGFNLGDKYNIKRSRSIKKRKLKFNNIRLKPPGYSRYSYADVEFIDKKSKEKIHIRPGYGWELFYSEELMNERLQDIESLWLQRYDLEAKRYDDNIKKLRKELREAERIRNRILGKSIEFQKKIKNILWKDF